jgi:conjugal transfer pilus assembly protein TraV
MACVAAVASGLSACSLNPYHSQFMCAASANHGKCESVDQAYGEALGRADTPTAKPGADGAPPAANKALGKSKASQPPTPMVEVSEETRYREAQYRKLAALVEEPVTPIVEPAKTMRTLILSYPAGDALYMPRYVFWIAEPPKFVIGDYLDPLSTADAKTIFPTGTP